MALRCLWGWTAWGAALCLITGCMTHDALYRELVRDREDAYEAWVRIRESGDVPIPAEHLSLDECVRVALLYNKSLQAKVQEREIARGQLVSAYRLALPSLDASATTDHGSADTDHAELVLRQPVFRAGGITAGLRAAKLYAYWSDESVRNTVQTVIRLVTASYYSVLLADSLCQVNRDAVTSAEAHLNDVRIKRANGVSSKYDELRAQVDVANFRAELIRQENNLVLAKTTLLRTLGTATDATIHLSDPLKHVAVTMGLDQAVKAAYRNRPDLYMAELNVRMQREQVNVLRSSYFPEVDLVVSAESDRYREGADDWDGSQLAALQFSWSLFDGCEREGELISARAKLKQREVELKDVEEDVVLGVQQALLNLKNADEYVESQRLSLQHAEEGLRLAMTGYREGVNTEVEIVDARSSLTEARGNHFKALYDHSMARLALDYAMGLLSESYEAK